MNTKYKNLNLIFELVKKGDIVVGRHLLALPAKFAIAHYFSLM